MWSWQTIRYLLWVPLAWGCSMADSGQIETFVAKLNKKQDGDVYVIDEQVHLADGAYEGMLAHDNAVNSTIKVFTGPKLTGEEITSWTLSTPAETPWRRSIRIFAAVPAVYISYETPGDQVEADDINMLQEAVTATLTELNGYEASNDAEVSAVKGRLTVAETNKAEKTYVDTQLLVKADKSSTYTKTETDQRIQAVVAAAPAALDTLAEIADALNNDPDFAGTMTTQLAGKVDKVSGKGLSTEDYSTAEKTKLAGIAAAAGTAGSATDAVIGNRTISDTAAPTGDSGTVGTLFGWLANMVKAITGKSNWRTAPATTLEAAKAHADDAVRHITAAERSDWTAKETLAGAQSKADGAQAAAVTAAAADAAGKVAAHAADGVKHITAAERTSWNGAVSAQHTHSNKTVLDAITQALVDGWNSAASHVSDAVRHITLAERTLWNAKASTDTATNSVNGLMSSTDKTKLDGIASGATNYTHPTGDGNLHVPATSTTNSGKVLKAGATAGSAAWGTVAASEVTQDASNRFVTDTEKTTWNAKAPTTAATTSAAGLMSAADKTKLDGVATGAQVNTVTSVAGRTGAIALVKADVGLGSVQNYDIATQAEAEAGASAVKYMTPQRTYQAIQAQFSGFGGGDMLKSVYDSDGDGIVDSAETVTWAGVTGKPTTRAGYGITDAMPKGPVTWGQLRGDA